MALYEYKCTDCGHAFEALVQSCDDKPACPVCGSTNLEKLLSTFAFSMKGSAKVPSCPSGGCCGGSCGMG
jgi:putative FmdB family regulatory protein